MPRRPPEPDQKIAMLDLAEVGCQSFQEIIHALEQKCPGPGFMPGTTITRVLLDPKVAQSYGLRPQGDDRAKAWCLTLGRMGEPKLHFYGWEIAEAVVRAVSDLLT